MGRKIYKRIRNRFFKRLSVRLSVTYGLIFLVSIACLDTLLIYNYSKSQYDKNEERYSNIVDTIAFMKEYSSQSYGDFIPLLSTQVEDFDDRVILMDSSGLVLMDNFGVYKDQTINNNEVSNVIETMGSNVGYYEYKGKKMMMIAIPIMNENSIENIVLFSAYVEIIKGKVSSFNKLVIFTSMVISLFFIILSFISTRKIVAPIRTLTIASRKIQNGELNTKVNIIREDEIGTLANTFNNMSEELYKIDVNRREFVSSVSHEFKTPLAAIRVLIESLDDKDEKDTYIEYMNDIYEETTRLSIMVNSLLTASRLEETKIQKEVINLKKEIYEVYKLLMPLAKDKSIKLENYCADDFTIEGDRGCIKEILINLVDNSIKYGVAGGYVSITTFNENDEQSRGIKITDNGLGISDKHINFIFDNFYTADKSRAFDKKGSGIGLYIVMKLVQLHQWNISVESTLGKGSIFNLYFSE
ncbi:HAMP domain-containing sensor histidine kinase [Clostridium grantii]|uniref:histidine kinase n=1 Tax=Clostridium grantii DSM 8605 TaxID=1121316 RepID=A0A1M5WTU2_9CLOT|nr:HAMP domain-containing sensor histidine kinase [Clostridium grantii]SHH90977.1 Signal transduction histidine kinase [Clostridium grantii DSM 8605]